MLLLQKNQDLIYPQDPELYKVDESLFDYTPTIQEMTSDQKALFDKLVQQEAIENGGDNPELYAEVLINFFTEGAENNFNIPASEQQLAHWLGWGIGVNVAGKVFIKTVTTKLVAWGAGKLAWAIYGAVFWAMDYFNIGLNVAKYLDSKDYKPKNGWIDFLMKRSKIEILVLALWMFSFSYFRNLLHIPNNILYLVIGFPIFIIGAILISYLFQKFYKK